VNDDADLAFRTDLERNLPKLLAFAKSLTGNPDRAADLVQEALVRAWQNRAKFEPGTNLKAWLFTVLRNTFIS
jgi:RNA polymerase sigma-70 factor (ECF subfamily)